MTKAELLALTPADFDFERQTVTINKSYQRLKGRDVITSPKTVKSNRTIKMPKFLCEEMQDYIRMLYDIGENERIFQITKSYLHHEMDRGAKVAGVKRIRIHDLRHSHVCLSKGYFKNCVRNVDFTGVSAIAYAPFSVVLSVDASDLEAFSFAIRSFSALRRL